MGTTFTTKQQSAARHKLKFMNKKWKKENMELKAEEYFQREMFRAQ